jgi:hypothetical protein
VQVSGIALLLFGGFSAMLQRPAPILELDGYTVMLVGVGVVLLSVFSADLLIGE